LSDWFKGAQVTEDSLQSGSASVYMIAAASKLQCAAEAVSEMHRMLQRVPLSEDACRWLEDLDFDRLYTKGTTDGAIPSHDGQWGRLATLLRAGDVTLVTGAVLADLNHITDLVDSAAEAGSIAQNLRAQSALQDFAVFSQMVAFVNQVEPLDDYWRKGAKMISVSGASA